MKRLVGAVLMMVMLPFMIIVGTTQSANAMGTWYTLNKNKSYCGTLFSDEPNWQAILHGYAVVGNDGILARGYILKGANMSWQLSTSCSSWNARTVEKAYGSYVVSANGWGIDGFSVTVGWPSVSVSGWDKSVSHPLDWAAGHASGSWSTADDRYFDAGNWGDVSQMRIEVDMTLGRYNGEQADMYLTDTSGNIQ